MLFNYTADWPLLDGEWCVLGHRKQRMDKWLHPYKTIIISSSKFISDNIRVCGIATHSLIVLIYNMYCR